MVQAHELVMQASDKRLATSQNSPKDKKTSLLSLPMQTQDGSYMTLKSNSASLLTQKEFLKLSKKL